MTIFTCGPQCVDGTENHKWDGPVVKLQNGGSSSCSRCGMLAIDHSLWMDDGLDEAIRNRAKGADTESPKAQDSQASQDR